MTVTINGTPVAAKISVDEAKKAHYLSVGMLKKALENLQDDDLVAIDRIEDSYFRSFGENGWKAIKVVWDTRDISKYNAEKLEAMKQAISNPEKGDPTRSEIIEKDGKVIFYEYSDAIPAFQAFLTKEGPDGKKVLFITPHY